MKALLHRRALLWLIVISLLPLSACKSSYKANSGTPLNSNDPVQKNRRATSQQRQASAPRKGPDRLPTQTPTETTPEAPPAAVETPAAPTPVAPTPPTVEPSPEPEPAAVEEPTQAPVAEPEPEPSAPAAAVPLPDDSGSTISVNRLVVCTGVENRNPVGVSDQFSTEDSPLTGFVSLKNSGAPTKITMVWVHEGKVRDRIELKAGSSSRWRTWSRKTIRRRDQGNWQLILLDHKNQALKSLDFVIE
ncbi:MAG: hypothetical protein CMH54_05940 [Myxococcales bacterium]|nr:hypothetical protein [Myxococcales bacterium]